MLNFVLKWEGGYSNHPYDLGGATNYGITQKCYTKWLGRFKDVKYISMAEVKSIYKTEYFDKMKCSEISDPALALVLFDSAVNLGVNRTSKMLQRAINDNIDFKVAEDGVVGRKTISAVLLCLSLNIDLAGILVSRRKSYYQKLAESSPTMQVFLKGWMNRVYDLEKEMKSTHLKYL